ncbi:hypothetical protein TTHERM_00971790 (macronuclear) [Tetrahymena thermophila SB210]|uniref:VHS domain-containing protein n=1 Tax=Tetrahymena thermophila (strain SB210) TaxID=312017 RepID=Q24DJ4_TETTS|nr:hypothetical protein TTHERM_00971790 [Tetrahymena thermophila SB210]EAS05854.1 hypothetical protein TTHERM_00971790 [Tetrahymena thermophila SB210]|eukprot:XP_001026099.1 hypothetical protein TTHERM_00971790 [Tetrahymena thermophila SB210]
MGSNQEQQENLKLILQNPDQYKEGSKPYKKGVQTRDSQKIALITETVQKIIIKKFKEPPIMQLSAVRLIKECFELFVQDFIDMVAEKILPIMSQVAHFQQNNQNINRGKEYFYQEDQEKNAQLEQLGNSFFRLVLECIYVWAKWYPDTQYANTYNNLVEQKITFPTSFTYFKPELINSTVDEILQRREEASRIRREQKLGQSHIENNSTAIDVSGLRNFTEMKQQQSNPNSNNTNNHQVSQKPINDNQYQETKTGGGPNMINNVDENPHVQVNNAIVSIQQIKNTLLEGLKKPEEMDNNLLDYFKQEFERFSENAQFYSQQIIERQEDGNEDLLGKLFNENEFSELFIKNCNEYLQGNKTWTDLQKVFQNHIKKPAYGEVSGTIGGYVSIRMKDEMLVSGQGQINNLVQNKIQKSENFQTSQNHFKHQADEEDMEQTIQRNTQFTEDNKKYNQLGNNGIIGNQATQSINQNVNSTSSNSKNLFQSNIAEDIEERKGPQDNHIQQLQPQNYNPSTQEKREEFANYEGGRRTLREALNKNEYEKYKFQLKSKTNFSKISQNQSNLSNFSSAQKKPQFTKYNSYRDSSNLNNLQDNPDEMQNKLQQTLDILRGVQEERDEYKNKVEEQKQEIERLNLVIQSLQNRSNY